MATTTSFLQSRAVREATFTLVFGDIAAARMFTLPAGARIIHWIVNVKTAFSGGTTTIDVGTTSASSNEIIDGESVAAVGNIDIGVHLLLPGHETTAVTDIYAVVGASNSAGEVDVSCVFSLEVDTPR